MEIIESIDRATESNAMKSSVNLLFQPEIATSKCSTEWTNINITQVPSDIVNFKQLIKYLENSYIKNEQVICKIRVNDLIFSEKDENQFGTILIKDIQKLELSTQSISTVIKDVLIATMTMLPKMIVLAEETSNILRSQKYQFNIFINLIECIQWLTEIIQHLGIQCNNKQCWENINETWDKEEKNLTLIVKQITQHLDTADFMILADIIEYDLTSCLQSWLKLFSYLEQEVQQK